MKYSSFVVEHVGFSEYADLEMKINLRRLLGTDIYLINMPQGAMPRGFHRKNSVDMGDSIDLIVSGNISDVQKLLRRIKSPVGIVKYAGQPVGELDAQARVARDRAEETKKRYCIYNIKLN